MAAPSPIPSLRNLIERTVTVADLVTTPLWSLDPAQLAVDAAAVLAARDFDVAGVAEDPVSRYVTRDALVVSDGTVDDVALPILASETVERSLPLVEFAKILRRRRYVFILDQDRVGWLATCADLQAPAVTVVVLSFLVAIEVGLASLLPAELGEGWFDLLSSDSQASARKLYEQKHSRNVATGLEDCLYFKDWLRLASRSPSLIAELGFGSRTAFDRATGSFADLRNELAHGGTLLDDVAPEQAIDRFTRIRAFADAVWDLLEHRSPSWDVFAATVITTRDGVKVSGPAAKRNAPVPLPAHIITAWNPGMVTRPRQANRAANLELGAVLRNHKYELQEVVGAAPDGSWEEESLLVSGMRRRAAAEMGERFGQLAVFELSTSQLLIVRCPDGKVMRRIDRF